MDVLYQLSYNGLRERATCALLRLFVRGVLLAEAAVLGEFKAGLDRLLVFAGVVADVLARGALQLNAIIL